MILLIVAVFVAGFGYGRWYGKNAGGAAQKGGRKILYYVDPMHPAYKSDKPGIAPDCGMKLEPVYEDGGAASSGRDRGTDLHAPWHHHPPPYPTELPPSQPPLQWPLTKPAHRLHPTTLNPRP